MVKKLIFSAPCRRQYFIEISKKEFDELTTNGVSSSRFWDEIYDSMIYRDWYFGCDPQDKSFEQGYSFFMELDGKEVEEFESYFKKIYKASLKNYEKENNSIVKPSNSSYFISMNIYHDKVEMTMEIEKNFDINKFTIEIEKIVEIGSNRVVEIYTPLYDGRRFENIELDDENKDDVLISHKTNSASLEIYDD